MELLLFKYGGNFSKKMIVINYISHQIKKHSVSSYLINEEINGGGRKHLSL